MAVAALGEARERVRPRLEFEGGSAVFAHVAIVALTLRAHGDVGQHALAGEAVQSRSLRRRGNGGIDRTPSLLRQLGHWGNNDIVMAEWKVLRTFPYEATIK